MAGNRLFIVDLGLTIGSGHNRSFLTNIPSSLLNNYEKIYVLAPSTFETTNLQIDKKILVIPILQDIYGFDLGISPAIFHDHRQKIPRNPSLATLLLFNLMAKVLKIESFCVIRYIRLTLRWLNARSVFRKDLEIVFKTFNLNQRDTVFLPSSEYIQFLATLKLKKVHNFRLISRFVGGLDDAPISSIEFRWSKSKLRKILFDHNDLIITAETNEHSELLRNKWQTPKLTIPETFFPVEHVSQNQDRRKSQPTVGLVGNPRPEKGTNDYYAIVEEVLKKSNWNCVVQIPLELTENFRRLDVEYPGRLSYFTGSLPSGDLNRILSSLSALVLPYNPVAYRYRNSAMLSSAVDYAVPVVSRRGSAIARIVDEYGIGFCYEEVRDIPNILLSLSNLDILDSYTFLREDFIAHVNIQWNDCFSK